MSAVAYGAEQDDGRTGEISSGRTLVGQREGGLGVVRRTLAVGCALAAKLVERVGSGCIEGREERVSGGLTIISCIVSVVNPAGFRATKRHEDAQLLLRRRSSDRALHGFETTQQDELAALRGSSIAAKMAGGRMGGRERTGNSDVGLLVRSPCRQCSLCRSW